MYVYVCMHVCIHVCMHVCMYVCMSVGVSRSCDGKSDSVRLRCDALRDAKLCARVVERFWWLAFQMGNGHVRRAVCAVPPTPMKIPARHN